MTAATYDITIDQGSDYSLGLVLKDTNGTPMNLTGYSARAQLRPKKDSTLLSASFTCTLSNPPTDGRITLVLPNATSTQLTAGTYYYDLEIYTSGNAYVKRLIEGKARIRQEVTR
jgi:hypothetical protein